MILDRLNLWIEIVDDAETRYKLILNDPFFFIILIYYIAQIKMAIGFKRILNTDALRFKEGETNICLLYTSDAADE